MNEEQLPIHKLGFDKKKKIYITQLYPTHYQVSNYYRYWLNGQTQQLL